MGNHISFALSVPSSKNSRSAKVILPNGEIRVIHTPSKAAELMLELEVPSSFIVNAQSMKIGHRFTPLSADEDLDLSGNVYVMFPMKRVNSVVTTTDMGVLFLAANSAKKRRFRGNKVGAFPASEDIINTTAEETVIPKLSFDDVEDFSAEEFMQQLSRSRKPGLETIKEEPDLGSFMIFLT